MQSTKETNHEVTEVTPEQRKASLSTIQVHLAKGDRVDVYTEVAAYQLMDAVLIIAQNHGVTTLIPMDTVINVTIRQKI